MPDEKQRLAALYAAKEDEELLALAQDSADLTDDARHALDDEISRRRLTVPVVAREQVEDRPLVEVGRFSLLTEAEVARSMLDSAGIESFLSDANAARIYVPIVVGGVALRVDPENAEAARAMLEAVPEHPIAGDDEEPSAD